MWTLLGHVAVAVSVSLLFKSRIRDCLNKAIIKIIF